MNTFNSQAIGRVDEIDRTLEQLRQEREHLVANISVDPLSATEAALVKLALEAGEMRTAYRMMAENNDSLKHRVGELQSFNNQFQSIVEQRDRALELLEEAAAKIEKLEAKKGKKVKK